MASGWLTRAKALRPKEMRNESEMKTSATSARAYVGVRRRDMASPSTASPPAISRPSTHRPLHKLRNQGQEELHCLPTLRVTVMTLPVTVPKLPVRGPALAEDSTSHPRPITSRELTSAVEKPLQTRNPALTLLAGNQAPESTSSPC